MTDNHIYVAWAQDENKPDRLVRTACNRCYGSQVAVRELTHIEVVSQYGTAHKGGDGSKDGHTDCGIDATGPTWWWRT